MKILSPLTNLPNVKLVKSIDVQDIIKGYNLYLNIDVKNYFLGISSIDLYKCNDSKLSFFSPSSAAGDSIFYNNLNKEHIWYYQEWKWEYQALLEYIKPENNVLEIGCGNGAFLNLLKKNKIKGTGLELNENAVHHAIERGLNVKNETIEQHIHSLPELYDIVIAFQVLEHVADIQSFINTSIQTLKKGGKLIFAVPNNDNYFLKYFNMRLDSSEYQRTLLLNMPPHHFNKWTEYSLKYLQNIFPIKLESILYEPLFDHRRSLNKNILTNKYSLYKYLPERIKEKISMSFHSLRIGDSIVAIYTKK